MAIVKRKRTNRKAGVNFENQIYTLSGAAVNYGGFSDTQTKIYFEKEILTL